MAPPRSIPASATSQLTLPQPANATQATPHPSQSHIPSPRMETIDIITGDMPVHHDDEIQSTASTVILEEHYEAVIEVSDPVIMLKKVAQELNAAMENIKAVIEKTNAIIEGIDAYTIARQNSIYQSLTSAFNHVRAMIEIIDAFSGEHPMPAKEKECPPWCHNPYCDCRN